MEPGLAVGESLGSELGPEQARMQGGQWAAGRVQGMVWTLAETSAAVIRESAGSFDAFPGRGQTVKESLREWRPGAVLALRQRPLKGPFTWWPPVPAWREEQG